MQSLWMLDAGMPAGLSPLKLAWLFGSLIAAGLALNFLVIYKTLRLARKDPDQVIYPFLRKYLNSSGDS